MYEAVENVKREIEFAVDAANACDGDNPEFTKILHRAIGLADALCILGFKCSIVYNNEDGSVAFYPYEVK